MTRPIALLALVVSMLIAPLVVGLPAAHAGGSSGKDPDPLTRVERIQKAVKVAGRQAGDPYKYGAEGPEKFDCSGLVYFSTHRAGLSKVPRTSSEQAEFMRRIKRSAMRRGDFVFFTGDSGVYHVGIYLGRKDGERRILHAPGTGEKVSRSRIWTDSWFAGTLRGK